MTISHLMTLEKEQETMPKTNNRKEILKIRVEINEKESTKTKLTKGKANSSEKYQRIDRHLVRLTRRKKNKEDSNTKIRDERGEIITDLTEIKGFGRKNYDQLNANELD